MARGQEASAEEGEMIVSHGYSFYGDLKYPADFEHYDYVNPDAPKGGELSYAALGTFDSMNPYTVKGRRGELSWIMYESLLGDGPADAYGEAYGLLAESLEYPATKDWVIFHMRPEAKFSDGTPVTAEDVMFSHNLLLEQGLPSYAAAVKKRIPRVEVLDEHTIKFYFTPGISRRSLIDQVGGVPVWSKKWFEESGARLDESRMETSPGSGPYMIDRIDVNRRIVYKRNPDYWGKDLAINQGRHNFDSIRVEYFGDDTASFEAFKAGEYTFRVEGDSKKWATSYNFPKIQAGQVVKAELPDGTPPTPSGIVFNLRREVMQDKNLREALSLAFNFEWTNESLQYNLFEQRASFSQDTPLMATGAPEGAELEFLKSLGDVVPAEMLTEEARMPHSSDGSRLTDRRNLRRAMKLLDEAGWPVGSDGVRRNADGKTLSLTLLFNTAAEGTLGAILENYVNNVQAMGIDITLEKVDPAQYTLREREFDYDLVFDSYRPFLGTGTGLMQMYGSSEAAFSVFNPAGLASPMVDAIIEASLMAENAEEEETSLRALDRALRFEFFMIPVWYKADYWVSYYDQYGYPEPLPPYDLGYLDFWWYDAEKAEALKTAGALR
ncbi:extracellular solute-binding protein [Heliomarina baculiformis]|uniref:extracellular solute-binding protein n=1 Tax=Heliomarina baculiformis TaxID=2872036 RepID=UPI001EE2C357|nr:extracellular solute-binding protein [Heliomarina baculiformis]